MHDRRATIVAVLGAALLVGAPAGWLATGAGHGDTAGVVPVGDTVTRSDRSAPEVPAPAAVPDARTTATDERRAPPATSAASTGTGTTVERPRPPATPVGLVLPSLDVEADLVEVGLTSDGAMEVPEDVTTAGWYELGVVPGEAGTAVIAGHVDSREQGPGAFFGLRDLDVGEEVRVDHADRRTSIWTVTGRTAYPKDEAPLEELFVRGGPTRLALITCGGAFDASDRSYTDNVVVFLEPHADAA